MEKREFYEVFSVKYGNGKSVGWKVQGKDKVFTKKTKKAATEFAEELRKADSTNAEVKQTVEDVVEELDLELVELLDEISPEVTNAELIGNTELVNVEELDLDEPDQQGFMGMEITDDDEIDVDYMNEKYNQPIDEDVVEDRSPEVTNTELIGDTESEVKSKKLKSQEYALTLSNLTSTELKNLKPMVRYFYLMANKKVCPHCGKTKSLRTFMNPETFEISNSCHSCQKKEQKATTETEVEEIVLNVLKNSPEVQKFTAA
jgi:hypothetical protein